MNVLEFFGVAKFNEQLVMVSPWMENGTVTDLIEKNPETNRYELVSIQHLMDYFILFLCSSVHNWRTRWPIYTILM